MNITGNTILITGGTSGIGLELAKQLRALDNTVLVTGRDPAKIAKLNQQLPDVHAYRSDVSDTKSIESLYHEVSRDFPSLNILINNAGIMHLLNLNGSNKAPYLEQEVNTNLLGPLRMTQQFLPLLKRQRSAAIINVSSGLAFVPLASAPVYSATKAALHSYTQSLRIQLDGSQVQVFELAPPPTRTPLLDNFGAASSNSQTRGTMKVDAMVRAAIQGLNKDQYEIKPGASKILSGMSRIAPKFILKQLTKSVANELAAMR